MRSRSGAFVSCATQTERRVQESRARTEGEQSGAWDDRRDRRVQHRRVASPCRSTSQLSACPPRAKHKPSPSASGPPLLSCASVVFTRIHPSLQANPGIWPTCWGLTVLGPKLRKFGVYTCGATSFSLHWPVLVKVNLVPTLVNVSTKGKCVHLILLKTLLSHTLVCCRPRRQKLPHSVHTLVLQTLITQPTSRPVVQLVRTKVT